MSYLVRWMDDWFGGRVLNDPRRPENRFVLYTANDERYEEMGFRRASNSLDRHYYRYFKSDPGFTYYPIIKYNGIEVSFQGIRAEGLPREALIGWMSYSAPPDIGKWVGNARDGFSRYVKIDELEKEEGTIPDWSLPDE
jgi:hypothetical protein